MTHCKDDHKPSPQAELLRKIHQLSGSDSDQLYQKLILKRPIEELTTEEYQELLAKKSKSENYWLKK